jgi:mRNA interferase MazF
MAGRVSRGDIWMFRFAAPDRRRPVLVLSRNSLLEVLQTATVVAVTSTRRGSPTEVKLGAEHGLKADSCANLTNVFTVRQADLRNWVGAVGDEKLDEICEALEIAVGCG